MPEKIDNDRLRSLLDEGDVQLVDVLPPEEYAEEHIAGAISLPLKRLDAKTVEVLDRSRPVAVYCWDYI
jgi:rhodanese-related sulfurtransferase